MLEIIGLLNAVTGRPALTGETCVLGDWHFEFECDNRHEAMVFQWPFRMYAEFLPGYQKLPTDFTFKF